MEKYKSDKNLSILQSNVFISFQETIITKRKRKEREQYGEIETRRIGKDKIQEKSEEN